MFNLNYTGAQINEILSNMSGYNPACKIAKLPGNVKVSCADFALTLHKGSKLFFPNGFEADGTTPKFDEFIVPEDVTADHDAPDAIRFVSFDRANGKHLQDSFAAHSGESASSLTGSFIFYNTKTNKIEYYLDSKLTSRDLCIPFCKVQGAKSKSFGYIIDVYDHCSYIGGTVFGFAGTLGWVPQGRDEKGIPVNKLIESYTKCQTASADRTYEFVVNKNGTPYLSSVRKYIPATNICVNTIETEDISSYVLADITVSNGTITSFKPRYEGQ